MELVLVVYVITSCLSISRGQTTGIDTFNVTDNSLVQQTIEEFNRYCQYTETCVNDTKKKNGFVFNDSERCCKIEQCSCSDTCGLNCCPDKLFTFTNEKDFYDAKELTRCVGAQYSPFYSGLEIIYSYEMISNCPFNYTDGKIVTQCRREYHEFDFQMPLRNFLPAYDQTKHRVYKNIFCAICHGADINDLDFAFLTYSCSNSWRNLTYLHDLAWNFSRGDSNCNFRFFPKSLVKWENKICDRTYINRCNVTRRWEIYDRQLEEKCLSYRADYIPDAFSPDFDRRFYNHNFKIPYAYRNIHCFLCNGFSEHDIKKVCHVTYRPDAMLRDIDFIRNVYSKEEDHHGLWSRDEREADSLCHNETIYNVSQEHIWNLECPFGMVLSDYNCVPPTLQEPYYVSMYVSLLLEPDHSQQRQRETSLFAVLSQISTEVKDILSRLVTIDNVLEDYIKVSVKLETDQIGNVTIDFGSIKEILIHTKVTLKEIRDAILPILDFALLFSNVTHIGDFKIKIRRQNPLIQDNRNHYCFFKDSWPQSFHLCHDDINDNIWITGTINTDMHDVIIGVEREPFCPRISLKKLAFAENTKSCNDKDILSQILTDNFLSKQLSENETHIFFCFKDYLQHVKNLKMEDVTNRGRNAKELALEYLTIVCLSASIVSLLTTIIIYALFSVLRTLPGLNIMALSVTLLVYHFMSLVSTITLEYFVNIPWLCRLIGIVTHFFLIQSFCWMFICTYHMMKVFIKIRSKAVPENISRTFILYIICAALAATLLVTVTVIVAEVKSGGQDIGYGGNGCYIKDPVMIMCFAAIPVALVVILNFSMFCVVLFKISRIPSLAVSKQKERQNTVIFIKLSTLTGLSSIFGFLFLFTEFYAFGYLYVVLNGGQGVLILISFIFNRRIKILLQSLASEFSRTGSSTQTSKL